MVLSINVCGISLCLGKWQLRVPRMLIYQMKWMRWNGKPLGASALCASITFQNWSLFLWGFNMSLHCKRFRFGIVQVWCLYRSGFATSHLFNHFTFGVVPSWHHCLRGCMTLPPCKLFKLKTVPSYCKGARVIRVWIGLRLLTSQTWKCQLQNCNFSTSHWYYLISFLFSNPFICT